MRDYFHALADAVCDAPRGVDRVMLGFAAESSDFVRFNQGRVRQATQVEQRYGTLSVVAGACRIEGCVSLSGDLNRDIDRLHHERTTLIAQLPFVPPDPHLLLPDTVVNTEKTQFGSLPTPEQMVRAVVEHGAGADLVGFYAGGGVQRAFADSRGQRNWHSVHSFQLDCCAYQGADKAVKTAYAGTHWDPDALASRLEDATRRSALLARPAKALVPGAYRVYFSPVAMADLLGTLGWGGFGLKGVRVGVSSLIRMHRDGQRLNAQIHLAEATGTGLAPCFQGDGFVKPDAVTLVRAGQAAGLLVSPRSAQEYGETANGSNAQESPDALCLAPGELAPSDVLKALGTGVFISNLHYLNYSDRQDCRITGMTRFACWWVEQGELVAPIGVMRFDDSILRMFGDGLVALTSQTETVPDSSTYGARQLGAVTTPGAIVEGFRLTL